MAADHEREARCLSCSCDHPLITRHAQWCEALRNEYIAARLALALQTAQGPEFAATNGVNAGCPALGAAHMECSRRSRRSPQLEGAFDDLKYNKGRVAWPVHIDR